MRRKNNGNIFLAAAFIMVSIGCLGLAALHFSDNINNEIYKDNLTNCLNSYNSVYSDYLHFSNTYPAREFRNVTELEGWLNNQTAFVKSSDAVVWFKHGLEMQHRAETYGFIISTVIEPSANSTKEDMTYIVYNSAVLQDGSLYWWDPDTKELYYWFDTNHF